MFVGRGIDTDNDGNNDFYVGAKIEWTEKEKRRNTSIVLIFLLVCFLVWIVGVILLGVGLVSYAMAGLIAVPLIWSGYIDKDSADGFVSVTTCVAFLANTLGIVFYSIKRSGRQKRTGRRSVQQPSLSESQQADRWFLRFPSGKIKGPGEGENIRVLARQGRYPPGTTWSQQANGPWVPIPGVKAAAAPTLAPVATGVQWWIRTPDGKQSGPHTKEQLAKAAAAGRLPQGTVAANSPNGPWKQVQLRKQP